MDEALDAWTMLSRFKLIVAKLREESNLALDALDQTHRLMPMDVADKALVLRIRRETKTPDGD